MNYSSATRVRRNTEVFLPQTIQNIINFATYGRGGFNHSEVTVIIKAIKGHGYRGTTEGFATIPFYLVLFSAALVELTRSIIVHSLILSSHLFFCPPLLFPFTVPCRIVFAKQEALETWLNHLSSRIRSPSYSPNGCLDLSANLLIGNRVLV